MSVRFKIELLVIQCIHLGDFIFKRNDEKPPEEQIVTAFPDVIVRDLTPDMEFFVLACDGIWDVLSNQDVVDFCRDRLAAKMEPETVLDLFPLAFLVHLAKVKVKSFMVYGRLS